MLNAKASSSGTDDAFAKKKGWDEKRDRQSGRIVRTQDAEAQFKAILERVLRAYHRDEGHGGANWIGERILDAELVPVAREAFLDADDMPPDHEVLQVLDGEGMHLLGEGYHVMALAEPANRFVVKYAKNREGIPPLAPPAGAATARGVGARSRRTAGWPPPPRDLAAHTFT